MPEMVHNDVSVFLEDGQCDKEVEAAGQIVRPQSFPKAKNIRPCKLALVPYKKHPEEEEKVRAIGRLEMEVKLGVHELNELIKS